MSELITDEIVEAAAREFAAGRELDPFKPDAVERARSASGDQAERAVERRREHQRNLVRPLLEAAAPLIAARALEAAAEALEVVPDHTASPYDQGRVDQRHADAFDLHERAARQKEARA